MTYPPQPGQYGGQPDPYGQGGQYGGYPQSGGFPQQGGYPAEGGQYGQYPQQGGYPQPGGQYGQYPQQGGYAQPGGQYGGYPQPGAYPGAGQYSQTGGFDGPPPGPKSKTGLWIGLGVGGVILLVGAVLFTGFVTPGFFLGNSPQSVAEKAVESVNNKDKDAVAEVICGEISDTGPMADEALGGEVSAKLTGQVREEGEQAFAPVELTFNGITAAGELVLEKQDGAWCVDDFKATGLPGPGGSSGSSGTGAGVIEDFLAKINSGDQRGAVGMLCGDSLAKTTVVDAIESDAEASIKETRLDSEKYISVDLGGTKNGNPSEGGASAQSENGTWCISTFSMF
ncbi:MAG: hypothetical protein ACRDQ7_24665 [Haloechinothrix sp.]